MHVAGWRGLVSVVGLVALAGCRGGCGKDGVAESSAARALGWFPAEAQIVVAIDFAQLRASPLGSALGSLATSDPDDRRMIDELANRTSFDPLKQVDSLLVAFPEEARVQGGMGMVLRGRGMDEARLVAYVRDQVTKQGDDLFSFRRAGRTLWATRREPTTAGFFVDDRTFVLGTGGWAEKMAELSRAPAPAGASTNATLVRLVERAGPTRSLWAAAIVPAATRASLAADPALASAAAVNRLALGIDVRAGVDANLIADLATRDQARDMAAEVGQAILAAKRSPKVLLLGVAPYLDGVTARAVDVSCQIAVRLSESQTADGIARLRAFLSLARQAAVPGFPHP